MPRCLFSGAIAGAISLSSSTALSSTALATTADTSAPDKAALSPAEILARLDMLDAELKAKQQEIDLLRRQLQSPDSRTDVPAPPTETAPSDSVLASNQGRGQTTARPAVCSMADRTEVQVALTDPSQIGECLPLGSTAKIGPAAKNLAAAQFAQIAAQPLFDRTGPTTGVQTSVTLGNSGEASISFGQTRFSRNSWRQVTTGAMTGFQPQTWNWSVGVRVPLDKGEGLIFKDKIRTDRADFDIVSNIRLRGDISFLRYDFVESGKRTDELASFLVKAHGDCLKDQAPKPDHSVFAERYRDPATPVAPTATPVRSSCSGSELVSWIIETTADTSLPSGVKFKRPQLAAEYQGMFWLGREKTPPKWGLGAAIEYGNRDFEYSQGALTPTPIADDPGQIALVLNPATPLAKSRTDSHDQWKFELYGLVYKNLTRPEHKRLPAWDVPGLMFLPSIRYERQYNFRPKTTDKSICNLPAAGAALPLDQRAFLTCSTLNVDRPYQDNHFFAAAELRGRINNIPVINSIGFAPKLSVRLDDGRLQGDLPIWLQFDKDGKGTAGIRLRHYRGGTDLVGNPQRPETDLSFFFVPLTFSAF